MSEDALKCFEYLVSNVPAWIADLERISQKAKNNQQQYGAAEEQNAKPRKSTSMESLRPNDDPLPSATNVAVMAPTSAAASRDTKPCVASQGRLLPVKRKAMSILSGRASGLFKYRARKAIVRNIGAGRGQLRKGKMTARMQAMEDECCSDEEDDEDKEFTIGYKGRDGMQKGRLVTGLPDLDKINQKTQVYDVADAALEKCQALCEQAAHLFLRDGGCGDELDIVRQHLESVRTISQAQSQRLRTDAEEKKRISAEQQRFDAEKQAAAAAESTPIPIKVTVPTIATPPIMDALEVDDDESEAEMDFNPAAFRRMPRGFAVAAN
ncbi:hypothetical protein H2203_002903 [Taxawa tesnikishii (nom. ined.)]|nr:hypothetical protein H2203_002903 [Dothideales sp. JES 119]